MLQVIGAFIRLFLFTMGTSILTLSGSAGLKMLLAIGLTLCKQERLIGFIVVTVILL
jgi:hypothetical protein